MTEKISKDENPVTFESAFNELQKIVEELDSGENISLSEMEKKFEDGIKLSKICQDALDAVEKKVKLLIEDQNGNPVEKDCFDDAEE